ncbi:MAG: hypothetical protein NXH95_14430 [Pseudomonadaceae bacterium]|nr:hypothetical protein [Pseudomonadaceae bacterium]
MGREIVTIKDVEERKLRTYQGGLASKPEGAPQTEEVDKYANRLMKYIPAEIVGAYIAIDVLFRANESVGTLFHWIAFTVLALATPVYLFRIQKVRKKLQLGVSTVAFAVWVAALPGPFGTLEIYSAFAAAVVLILYTTLAALIEA